ncbi:MAG: carboxypeptidase-like regulatory domain-containing protein [Pseudomonadota bacterium]
MIIHKRIQLTKLALALSIALSAAPTFAQNTTSAIAGRISGADGKPASGATVSIVHTESGSVSNVTTDSEGRYVARGLRTGGPYTIIITKNGVTEKREGIYTVLAETAAVDAVMGAPIQQVTVTGSSSRANVFSRTNMGAGTSIGATELATQASIGRNLQDYARADPRVAQTDKERGEMSVAGQNFRFNSMTIDGVSVNDTFGLESNGSPTVRQPLSIEAIQSVQVNVANYDVTQKGYTGANVNAVTKSGTNTWKGAGYFAFRNDKMAGDRYNVGDDSYYSEPYKETTKGAWVSGPLIKDTLFLFALVEENKSTRNVPSFGIIGSPATNVAITQSAVTAAQDIAKNTWGMDIGTLKAPPGFGLILREKTIKLDWNINDDHRANIRYTGTSQAEPFFGGSSTFTASNIGLSSIFYSQAKQIDSTVAQLFSDWTPAFSTELKISQRDLDSVPNNQARLPTMQLQFSGLVPEGTKSGPRSLNFGTEPNRHVNALNTKTTDLYAGGNWHIGEHELKFGFDHTKNTIFNAFLPSTYGNYTFSCMDSSGAVVYSFGAITCKTASTALIEQAVLENFKLGRASSYSLQQPAPNHTFEEAFGSFSMANTGLFFQDTWNVTPALTLNYGVRLDRNTVNGKPLANAAAAAPMVPGNATTRTRQSGGFGIDNTFTIDGQNLFQPRFGFNYKLPTATKMQLRGGAGLFQGAAATVWMANPFSNHGVATRQLNCNSSAASRCPTTSFFSPDPDNQPVLTAVAIPAASLDFLDKNITQPSVYKANLAFDTELPWYGLVFGAEFLYTKNKDGIYYQHLNLGTVTKVGSDQRNMYYNPSGLNPLCWSVDAARAVSTANGCTNTTKSLNNSAFGNVIMGTATDLGRGMVATVSVTRPMIKGIGFGMAYSRTDATDVSPLSNSIANSVFNARAAFDPNENVASNSSYLVKDRISATFNFQRKLFGEYNTRVGMFYEGRSGRPYSWIMTNDLNGDGLTNDLMYIPKAFGSGDVTFYGDSVGNTTNERKFWDIVDANDALKSAAGGVVKRNSDFAKWTNSFDMRISQEIPGIWSNNKATFTLDFMNVGNMLNKKWGRINEIIFQPQGGNARSFVNYAGLDANGKYIYVVTPLEAPELRQTKGESQWAIQATVKYEF